jgi:hypothetical protein
MDNDKVIGLLLGEVIWLRKLNKFTEHLVEVKYCTEDEKKEYNTLSNVWYDKVTANRHLQNSSYRAPKEWITYRQYANFLCEKYCPAEIEFRDYFYANIINKKSFYEGIRSFLWDTDACSYTFSENDIEFITDEWEGASGKKRIDVRIKIKFHLDKVDPVEQMKNDPNAE